MSALDTWASNAIEGGSLERGEVEKVLLEGRTPGGHPVREVLVAVQHDDVFKGLFGRVEEPITVATALELHARVFWRVLDDAGKLRRDRPSRGSPRPAPPEWLPPMLTEWEDELGERELAGDEVMATAAWMHGRFLAIRPFTNGNGQVARLLLNLYLLRHSWPPVHATPGDRERYMAALEATHAGDPTPLGSLLWELSGRSLLLLLDRVGTDDDGLMPVTELGKEGPYSAKYLGLRAGQGELPAVKEGGRWWTSRRAVGAYREAIGKG